MDYFDQFNNVLVDANGYLKQFSEPNYSLKFSNLQPAVFYMQNLFESNLLTNDFFINNNEFTNYKVLNYEKPEVVSEKFYNDKNYWWFIFLCNNITNPMLQWPVADNVVSDIAELYYKNDNKYSKTVYFNILSKNYENQRNIKIYSKRLLNLFVANISSKK